MVKGVKGDGVKGDGVRERGRGRDGLHTVPYFVNNIIDNSG